MYPKQKSDLLSEWDKLPFGGDVGTENQFALCHDPDDSADAILGTSKFAHYGICA
jgi:hypothetical protein